MYVLILLVCQEGIPQSPLLRDGKGIADPPVICLKSHDSPQQRPVRAVSAVSPGKGTVQGKLCLDNLSCYHFLGQEGYGHRSRRV